MTYFRTFLAALVVVVLAGPAMAEDYRLGVITPPTQLWSKLSQTFADDLAEASDGRISISVFPAGQLGNEPAMLQQMQRGSIDFMLITGSELANQVEEFNALLAPRLVTSARHAADFLSNGETPKAMLDILENELGVKGLAYGQGGVTQVITNFDASTPEDLKGRRVRITPSPALLDYNQLLGTAPQAIGLPGLFDAFANRQVDAAETQLDQAHNLGLHTRAESLLLTNHAMFPSVVVVSSRLWRQLTTEDQAMVQKAAKDFGDAVLYQQAAAEESALEKMRSSVDVVEIEPSYFDDIVAEWDAKWEQKAPLLKDLRSEASRFE